MANTGKMCILLNRSTENDYHSFPDIVIAKIGAFVDRHATLKNLDIRFAGDGRASVCPNVLFVDIDRLTKSEAEELAKKCLPPGAQVAVVDCAYGDEWEVVEW